MNAWTKWHEWRATQIHLWKIFFSLNSKKSNKKVDDFLVYARLLLEPKRPKPSTSTIEAPSSGRSLPSSRKPKTTSIYNYFETTHVSPLHFTRQWSPEPSSSRSYTLWFSSQSSSHFLFPPRRKESHFSTISPDVARVLFQVKCALRTFFSFPTLRKVHQLLGCKRHGITEVARGRKT